MPRHTLSIHPYRYGEAAKLPGLSIGATHYLPRGIKKTDYARKGYFEVWLPLLAPSAQLVTNFKDGTIDFMTFAQRYRREMAEPAPRQALRLVASFARHQRVNVGCFCEDESRCHRSLLPALIEKAAAELPPESTRPERYASPACSMPEIED